MRDMQNAYESHEYLEEIARDAIQIPWTIVYAVHDLIHRDQVFFCLLAGYWHSA